jgi:hypothetical protein
VKALRIAGGECGLGKELEELNRITFAVFETARRL